MERGSAGWWVPSPQLQANTQRRGKPASADSTALAPLSRLLCPQFRAVQILFAQGDLTEPPQRLFLMGKPVPGNVEATETKDCADFLLGVCEDSSWECVQIPPGRKLTAIGLLNYLMGLPNPGCGEGLTALVLCGRSPRTGLTKRPAQKLTI